MILRGGSVSLKCTHKHSARADSLTKGWHHEAYVHLFIQILCASVCIPLSVKLEWMQDSRPPLAQIPQVQRVVCTGWDQRPLEDRKDTACNPSAQQELLIHRLCRAVIIKPLHEHEPISKHLLTVLTPSHLGSAWTQSDICLSNFPLKHSRSITDRSRQWWP